LIEILIHELWLQQIILNFQIHKLQEAFKMLVLVTYAFNIVAFQNHRSFFNEFKNYRFYKRVYTIFTNIDSRTFPNLPSSAVYTCGICRIFVTPSPLLLAK